MSMKHNKTAPRHWPYNISEIKNAGASLKLEVEKGSLRFLQRQLTFTEAGSCRNVWEGDQGFMENVKSSFPMPEKIESVIDHSQGEDLGASNVVHDRSLALTNDLNSKPSSVSDKNKNSEKSEVKLSKTSPTTVSTNSCVLKDDVNGNHTIFDSEDDDCVIVEEEQVAINVEKDKVDTCVEHVKVSDIASSLNASSNAGIIDEVMHWKRLFILHDEIIEAKQRLNKINTMFQYEYSEAKACEDIGPLRGHITNLIKRLRQAKDDIDNRNFSDTLSPELRKQHFYQKVFKSKSSSYKALWSLFKALCNKFVSIRKKWKKCLIQHNHFQDSSPTEFQSSIQVVESNIRT